jgi:death on curing protein
LSEPLFLTEEQIIGIHAEQIRRFGGSPGLRDAVLLGSAVMQPQNAHFYGGNPSLFDLAAEYAFSLGKNHAFYDGNKRVAAAAAIAFLDVNGWLVEEPFTEQILALVTNKMTKAEFSAALKRVSRQKENKVIDMVSWLQEWIAKHS